MNRVLESTTALQHVSKPIKKSDESNIKGDSDASAKGLRRHELLDLDVY